ncbi:LysR substrate-binding domain-containing protein [Aliamphritea ceti]|uniref:LysR substrate-binding domain-containing protein n=1 Tax=Aliamphritea ceti TaxID=1524258 RepID=UPI0021C2AC63|nr:LysR substrate-binding domain-containing protein [Aliamphritea ceti]
MRFRHYDSLRLFDVVARHLSFTQAAEELHLTKGAVSYQISRLEEALGFSLFIRKHKGILLTPKGKQLWHASQTAFHDLENLITQLREDDTSRITVGMSTYFASRWLSPRLMNFMAEYPNISLRLQPMIDLADFHTENIDMAIRWGKGSWPGMNVELLLQAPVRPATSKNTVAKLAGQPAHEWINKLTLLHDRENSPAWQEWHQRADEPYHAKKGGLVIQDPNVRVQAMIDGQGVALYDDLIAAELNSGQLNWLSDISMPEYGYFLVYPANALNNPALQAFRDWIIDSAEMAN